MNRVTHLIDFFYHNQQPVSFDKSSIHKEIYFHKNLRFNVENQCTLELFWHFLYSRLVFTLHLFNCQFAELNKFRSTLFQVFLSEVFWFHTPCWVSFILFIKCLSVQLSFRKTLKVYIFSLGFLTKKHCTYDVHILHKLECGWIWRAVHFTEVM